MRLVASPPACAPVAMPRCAAPRRRGAPQRRRAAAEAAMPDAAPLSPSLRVEWAARWAAASLALSSPPPADEAARTPASAASGDAGAHAKASEVQTCKAALLRLVASLDRGAAATPSDRVAVDAAVAALERASRGAPGCNAAAEGSAAADFGAALSGVWRLAYSSTFAGEGPGSQGFTGAPGAGTPVRLLGVTQRVSWRKKALDNIVELRLPAPFPLPGGVTVVATLAHTLEPMGGCGVRIEFTELQLRLRGVRGARPVALSSPLRALGLDAALPPSLKGGAFETTFLDADARVSRGDRGETRVFVRA